MRTVYLWNYQRVKQDADRGRNIQTFEYEFPEFFETCVPADGRGSGGDYPGGGDYPAGSEQFLDGIEGALRADPTKPELHWTYSQAYGDIAKMPPRRSDERGPGGPSDLIPIYPWPTNSGHYEVSDQDAWNADAVAWYLPWHCDQEHWGIYFREDRLRARTRWIWENIRPSGEEFDGVPQDLLTPFVLSVVREHEFTHFEQEIAGAVIECLLGHSVYLDYLSKSSLVPSDLPVNEVLATFAEVRFARSKVIRSEIASWLPSLRGLGGIPEDGLAGIGRHFGRAVRSLYEDFAPGTGYGDFALCEREGGRGRDDMLALFVAQVLGRDAVKDRRVTGRWLRWRTLGGRMDRMQVPQYWVGSFASGSAFGFEKVYKPT